MEETVKGILLDQSDDVVTVIGQVHAGATVCWEEGPAGGIDAVSDIPRFHKIAIRDIRRGEPILKYGHPIGCATVDIPKGMHVHTQNCAGTAVEELQK